MKRIIVLKPEVANKIAAGEVVERPASIVKELLENSLDAGATSVTIEIRGGGIDYIRITDNGSGIPSDDVPTAFMRHATSKLTTADDLNNITSFGFRGEALASIAAVSKVSMRTRTAEADYGVSILIEGGKQTDLMPCACPVGTTIEVNELFFNVPARLKFIKNQRTEGSLIMDYAARLMLANPDISFKFINNGRTVLQTNGNGDLANCIFGIYGSSVFSSVYKVEYDDGYISISGYVGGESIARANRTQQSVFINRRYIKSALISNAVQRAFLTRLMNHRFPFFVLSILISNREVDVNVHPNKLTVRFSDEERVANAVTSAITAALKRPMESVLAHVEAKTQDRNEQAEIEKQSVQTEVRQPNDYRIENVVRDLLKNNRKPESNFENAKQPLWVIPLQPDYSLKDIGSESIPDFSVNNGRPQLWPINDEPIQKEPKIPTFFVNDEPKEEQPQFMQKPEQISLSTDRCRIIGTAFDTYIIVQQGDSIFYIDQHAAHERIRYEKLIAGKLKFDSQLLAVPMIIDLDPAEFNCVVQNIERFEEFGYSFDCSVDTKLRVDAVPNFDVTNPQRFLREVIDCVMENSEANEIDIMRSRIIQMSCKGAVKAGDTLDIQQLQAIVDAYKGDSVPLTCPHGRPVLIQIKKTDLQKMFKRII